MPEIVLPYTDVELTDEVNRIPNNYGLINALNLAPSEPMASRYVRIAIKDGQLLVLAASEPGSPGQTTDDDVEKDLILMIPHFTHLEAIRVGDLQGVLEVVNGQVSTKSLDREIARKLATIRNHHSATREYIRIGMVKGLIKDGSGRTLYNLFDVFEINKKTVPFALGTATTNVREKCEEVYDHILSNVKGETVGMVECLVDTLFFEKLVSHEKVEKFWLNQEAAGTLTNLERQNLGGNWGRVFEFGNIMWREYKGSLPVKSNGTLTQDPNIAANMGHAYPSGTMSMFRTFDGPVHHIERVNEAPEPEEIYISTETLKHGEGFEMKSQSNAIAVCKQPECLVELTTN